jgi:hypothetical protein
MKLQNDDHVLFSELPNSIFGRKFAAKKKTNEKKRR